MLNFMFARALIVSIATLAAAFVVLFPDNSPPDLIAHFLSDQVNDAFQLFTHLLMFATGWWRRSWQPVIYDAAVTLVVTGIVQASKQFLIADIALRPSGGYEGFPSGHASASFSLAYILSIYYPRFSWLWYSIAVLVTWARVQTNAHSELQIAAGMLLGNLVAYSAYRLLLQNEGGSTLFQGTESRGTVPLLHSSE